MVEIVPWDSRFSNPRILVHCRDRFEEGANQWLTKDFQVVLFRLNVGKEELEKREISGMSEQKMSEGEFSR